MQLNLIEMFIYIFLVDYLQDAEILRQYVARLSLLGWTSKQEFEEIWMCLLQVLTISKDDLTDAEVGALSQCSALVIKGITALLLQTMRLPNLGHTIVSKPIHHSRHTPNAFFDSNRGRQLANIQYLLRERIANDSRDGSTFDCGLQAQLLLSPSCGDSFNLERCHSPNINSTLMSNITSCSTAKGHYKHGYSDYTLGQLSVNYLLNIMKDNDCKEEHEWSSITATTGSSLPSDADSKKESIKSQPLPFRYATRQQSLTEKNMDLTVRSCLHLLIQTLYTQWLVPSVVR